MTNALTSGEAEQLRRVRVRSTRLASSTVKEVVLEPVDGEKLGAWEPGAHIDVRMPDGMERQFSLVGDPSDLSTYRLGVLREPAGRGGSAWMHDYAEVDVELEIRGPKNTFALRPAESYHLVAGGVGITPLLPMVRQLAAEGREWRLTYLGDSRESMAFLDELEPYGDRVTEWPKDERGSWDVVSACSDWPQGAAMYACGPERLLLALEAASDGWPSGSLHLERFLPKELPDDIESAAFEIELAQSGQVHEVPPDKTVLAVVEETGIFVPSSCREGTCGTCETVIISGEADHRDSILSSEEQEANEVMMICVSRAKSRRLVLDL